MNRSNWWVEASEFSKLILKDWDFHPKDIIGLWERMHQARSLAPANTTWGREWGHNSVARHRLLLDALEKGKCEEAREIIKETISLAAEGLVQGLREVAGAKKRNNS